MPDLDSLDEIVAPDNASIRDRFGVETFASSCRMKSRKVVTLDTRKVKAAVECIKRLPRAGEYIHMIVGGEFAGFDLIPAMLQLSGAKRYSSLHLTTLGFSRNNLAQLEAMLRAGQIPAARLKILCGEFFRANDDGLWAIGRLLADEWKFEFRSYRNHTKIILAELDGCAYVVEGSANLRSCRNIEQFTLSAGAAVHQFHRRWLEQCLTFAKR